MRGKQAGSASAQAEFLQGDIVTDVLPGTGVEGLGGQGVVMRNWTTPVCRVISRLFNCGNPQPITRSPFCDTKKDVEKEQPKK